MKVKHLNILGTRGVPASHGGFETFAERLALYLVSAGWTVNVYCQEEGPVHLDGFRDEWSGVARTHFGTRRTGPLGTMEFDLKCVRDVVRQPGLDLVLGYNTAIFTLLQRFHGRRVVMNMDGIEWRRSKWSAGAKVWFFLNELIGANLAQVPVADHPVIASHVARRSFRKPVMIPYGGDVINQADAASLTALGAEPGKYLVSIARIEPENSILEFVRSAACLPSGYRMVVLGSLHPDNTYHRTVRAAGGDKVLFPGAIYDQQSVRALRYHARAYLHGHQVGGTNPSLVEALGAGNAVIAHDNPFNRWTAGEGQFFFSDEKSCRAAMLEICSNDEAVAKARMAARARHEESFLWADILRAYEAVLLDQLDRASR